MPSILHHKMAICHSWACAAQIIRKSVCGTVMEIYCMYRPALQKKLRVQLFAVLTAYLIASLCPSSETTNLTTFFCFHCPFYGFFWCSDALENNIHCNKNIHKKLIFRHQKSVKCYLSCKVKFMLVYTKNDIFNAFPKYVTILMIKL